MKVAVAVAIGAFVVGPALAQESGWHYSPYPGEGDRAALGCSAGSTAESHTCLAVRCEDDFSTGLYIETTRGGGDAGGWTIHIDEDAHDVTAVASPGAPYGAKVAGDVAPILAAIKDGTEVFLDPATGEIGNRRIALSGSLYAINQALFFCAPMQPARPGEAATPRIDPTLVAPEPAPAPQLTR